MKNRLVFRILGALASALIIVSVFIPFVSVTGHSQSLWKANSIINTLYLPIMIIVFGSIGVLAFAINIKTELAYASSGALLFYLVTQTIPVIEQNLFNTLSVGYYCLAVGTVLTGIMAFICNLRVKKKVEENIKVEETTPEQLSVIDQIDKLYDDQISTSNSNISQGDMVQPLQNSVDIQPLPVQPLQPVQPVQPIESIQQNDQIYQVEQIQSIEQPYQVTIESNNKPNDVLSASEPIVEQKVEDKQSLLGNESFNSINPVTAEFGEVQQVQSNPVTAEFGEVQQVQSNPVTTEFGEVQQTQTNLVEPISPMQQENEIQPLSSTNKPVDVMAEPTTNNGSNLDIFG